MILYLAIFFAGVIIGQGVAGFIFGKQVDALANIIREIFKP